LWNYLRRPALPRLLWCGFAMGALLCAKFSAVVMIPVALLLMLAAPLLAPRTPVRNPAKPLIDAVGHFAVMSIVALLVVMTIYFSPSGLSDYVHGFRTVYADHSPDFQPYMAGRLQHRFVGYFAVAWLLKEPLAAIGLVILGSVVLIRRKRLAVLDKLFIFLPPGVLFIACTVSAANIGIRYLIPAFPFACLAGGAGLAMLIRSQSKWLHGLAAVLCVWIAVAAAGIYPDHLSYFNEAACLLHDPGRLGWDGGTKCGTWWLEDSNTDWGQGLAQLRTWRNAHLDSRPIKLAYFGSFPPEPYGIVPDPIQNTDLVGGPVPGLYVISAKFVSRLPVSRSPVPWLRTMPPTAIVGHALYVYDIRPNR
jgi:hypothetical protein